MTSVTFQEFQDNWEPRKGAFDTVDWVTGRASQYCHWSTFCSSFLNL